MMVYSDEFLIRIFVNPGKDIIFYAEIYFDSSESSESLSMQVLKSQMTTYNA